MSEEANGNVYFEAVLKAESGISMFQPDTFLETASLDVLTPGAGAGTQAGTVLQELGFKVHHIGTYSISASGPRELWEKAFSTKVELKKQPRSEAHPELGEESYWSHIPDTPFTVPDELGRFVERAYPQAPPEFYSSALPPCVEYHHLRVPSDVAMIMRATQVHRVGVNGAGVLVAMPDTGFFRHPFYEWHGYNYNATLSPDAIRVEDDEYGHGTAEAANLFATAPNIDFVGIKMGRNSTLAFKTASDLQPAVITCSWGYNIAGWKTLPNYLKPLEAAVIEAVRKRGITVCISGGNGTKMGFPGMMPDVLSVGGVLAHRSLNNGDFKLEASNYASSYDSLIYPARHIPDFCGLVGMQPRGVYIMLPVQPGDRIDKSLAAKPYPNGDNTAPNDGWAVISGTSAASPMVAGVCALLKQVEPGLSPDLIKAILKASARDVKDGVSAHGQSAGEGFDGATGAGLVDAYAAYKLARSVATRNLFSLPPPR